MDKTSIDGGPLPRDNPGFITAAAELRYSAVRQNAFITRGEKSLWLGLAAANLYARSAAPSWVEGSSVLSAPMRFSSLEDQPRQCNAQLQR